jgi:hypothetical protein
MAGQAGVRILSQHQAEPLQQDRDIRAVRHSKHRQLQHEYLPGTELSPRLDHRASSALESQPEADSTRIGIPATSAGPTDLRPLLRAEPSAAAGAVVGVDRCGAGVTGPLPVGIADGQVCLDTAD